MELLAIPFFIIMLVLVGVGIAVGLAACVVAAALVLAGVVYLSAIVGILRGSVLAGVRALVWQGACLAGAAGGICIVAATRVFLGAWREEVLPWLGGALGGMAGGVLVALLLDFLLRRAANWLEKKHG